MDLTADTLFKVNEKPTLEVSELLGSKIYTIDDFYVNPTALVQHLLNVEAPLWKSDQKPSFNGDLFEDRRANFHSEGLTPVVAKLSEICGELPYNETNLVLTNQFRMKDNEFNSYSDSYWHPHLDSGYTALIYLCDGYTQGTNLYEPGKTSFDYFPEHYRPWKPRSLWNRIATLEGKFNRMILFDGHFFPHGQAIEDDYFVTHWRLNQAIFFSHRS